VANYNVCVGCGHIFETDATESAAITRHLKTTRHPGTVSTTQQHTAQRWANNYASATRGGVPDLETP
jgi:hypothetical protein